MDKFRLRILLFGILIIICLFANPTVTQQQIDWEGSDYPFMATVYGWNRKKLAKIENDDHFCTGALVGHNQVITSRPCAYNLLNATYLFEFMKRTSSLEVHHLAFCSRTSFIRRTVSHFDIHEQIVQLWLAPFRWEIGCHVPRVTVELSQFVSRKVQLLSTIGEKKLLITNGSIVSLEFMQMCYGPEQYSVVLEDGAPLPKQNYTSLIMLDSESKQLLGIVFDSSVLLKDVYRASYFHPEDKKFLMFNFFGPYIDESNVTNASNFTDLSITYSATLNVTKPGEFKFRLDEVDWSAHKYIVQICNKRTTQICTSALVDANTVVTSPKCVTQSLPNDTFVVKHFAQNRNTAEWELVTRGVTKWRTVNQTLTRKSDYYIFMSLSLFPLQDEYNFEILNRPNQSDKETTSKQYRYVRLVSLDWHFSAEGATCDVSLNGTMPKVAQLDTIASLNPKYKMRNETVVYDCHIFDSSSKNILDQSSRAMTDYAFETRNSMKFDSKCYSSTPDGLTRYNVDWHESIKLDYSLLFNESAILLDYLEATTKSSDKMLLLGLGFVEQHGASFCRSKMKKSINVLTVAKFEPDKLNSV